MKTYTKPMIKQVSLSSDRTIAKECWSDSNHDPNKNWIHDPNGTARGWIVFRVGGCNNPTHTAFWVEGYLDDHSTWGEMQPMAAGQTVTYKDNNGVEHSIAPLDYCNEMLGNVGSNEHAWQGPNLGTIFDETPSDS